MWSQDDQAKIPRPSRPASKFAISVIDQLAAKVARARREKRKNLEVLRLDAVNLGQHYRAPKGFFSRLLLHRFGSRKPQGLTGPYLEIFEHCERMGWTPRLRAKNGSGSPAAITIKV